MNPFCRSTNSPLNTLSPGASAKFKMRQEEDCSRKGVDREEGKEEGTKGLKISIRSAPVTRWINEGGNIYFIRGRMSVCI